MYPSFTFLFVEARKLVTSKLVNDQALKERISSGSRSKCLIKSAPPKRRRSF